MQLTLVSTPDDRNYLPRLKPIMGSAVTRVLEMPTVDTWKQVEMAAKGHGSQAIISTHPGLLKKLAVDDPGAVINDYAGSWFERDGLPIIFLDPLKQLVTVPYGQFLTQRYVNKLVYPDRWIEEPEFTWEIANESTVQDLYNRFCSADLIAVDTETFKENLVLRCVGYCGVWFNADGTYSLHTIVIPLDQMFFVTWMRKFNRLPGAKILQNGKYDHAYFFRYNAPCENWLWDTKNMMHAWFSELPKTLGFLGPFFRRKGRYWKGLAETASNLEEYYLYNARDCFNTALVMIAWIMEAPDWAKQNYLMKFPVNFPAHMGEMRGLKVNMSRRKEQETKLNLEIDLSKKSLEKMTDVPGINSNSHVQVKQLLTVLGCGDIAAKSSDEKSLEEARYRHPLNRRILGKIIDIRGARKLVSTYLPEEKFYKGRLLFSVNPDGTDTGRAASGESPFWCGYNIQNIPAYTDIVKQIVEADDDFYFGEADFSQAESRGTMVLTGSPNLVKVFVDQPDLDFHSFNAASFTGRPYEEIWDVEKHKAKDKPFRNLFKRVNHGANYMMGAQVLVATLGLELTFEAARMLNLPKHWTAIKIAGHLLEAFEATYPEIRDDHPKAVVAEILATRKLVGPTGWTRYCFSDPDKNKRALNSYVAHRAQSLNAMILDKAFLRVFYEIAMHPEYKYHFKLITQIHDSIFFMYRKGHEYLCEMVRKCMNIPVVVKDLKGIERELVVPVDVKYGTYDKAGTFKPAKFWAECGD